MKLRLLACLLGSTLVTPAPTQSAATTLAELAQRADAIALTQVLAIRTDAETCAVQLAVRDWLVGDGPATLELREPARRACGRALHGLLPGAGYVVFL